MATSRYVGIDVSKDRLDVAVLGEERGWQLDNTQEGLPGLVEQMQELQPELIVVEATGGYQRGVVEALFWAGLAVAMVNPTRVRQFARACGLLAKTDRLERMIDRIIEGCIDDNGRGHGNENSRISSNGDDCVPNTINRNLEISGEEKSFSGCDINGNLRIHDSEVRFTNSGVNGNVSSEDSDLTVNGTEMRGNVHANGGSIELINSTITGN